MRTKLFTRDDFYTNENVRRFFGDYYDITWDKNIKKLSIWSVQKTAHITENDSPWVPCFRGGELSKWEVKEKDKEVTRTFFHAQPTFYYPIGIDLFETIFGYARPYAARPVKEYFPWRSPHTHISQEQIKRMKEEEEKRVFHHQYGRKILNYFYKKDDYQAGIEIETRLSGAIFNFSITSEGE